MTHHDPDLHLDDDEVLRAMIDPSDLGAARQAHLHCCRHCLYQTEALTASYRRLGQMAREMAPEPRQALRVPADKAPGRPWYLKPAMALGVLGALVFAVTPWRPLTRISPTPTPMVAEKFENDDRLMEEIDALVEDALPEKYRQLAALPGERSVEDLDAFIDWVVPSPEDGNDWEQSGTSQRETGQGPLARYNSTDNAERGMV
ncbi:MAG: hypothetical protein V2J65_27955 [Desulfobacteraceae bacterium]|jgi:hypothetical protein|nr:hypothetical protein [Desulfobacteraceae bacterium]